jgi:diguanylate cyclase (GGDEF)-like protein
LNVRKAIDPESGGARSTSALRPVPLDKSLHGSVRAHARKPSGTHRIERPAPELDAQGHPVSGVQELSYRAASKSALEPQARLERTPHLARFATRRAALIGGVLLVGAHWLFTATWAHVLIALSPLCLLWLTAGRSVTLPGRAQWALYSGLLWLALAWAELVHPSAAIGSFQLPRLAALSTLALILLRLQQIYSGMHELGRRDPLTGLLNRRGLDELGGAELRRAGRYNRAVAFALLDVDRFKQVNDLHGHAAGDRVLKLVASELTQLRNSDLAVRLGGDEFGLLMPETDLAGAEQLVARLQQRMQERMRELGFAVTLSVGIASWQAGRSMDGLIADADARMYAAKGSVARG